jgi:hypothetical protein
VAGAMVAGCVALGTAQVAPNDFVALAAGAAATVVVAGLLVYRMRTVLASLRSMSAEPG